MTNDKNRDAPWIIKITCPFCDKVVLEATDFSLLPSDMPEDEKSEIESSEEWVTECDHVAFSSDWAYIGPSISDKWTKEMELVARAIDESDNGTDSYDAAKVIDDYRMSTDMEDLKEMATKLLPQYDCACADAFVNKNDGVSGAGGASHGVLFLKKKE